MATEPPRRHRILTVLTCLPSRSLSRLSVALGGRHRVVEAHRHMPLAESARAHGADVVVTDLTHLTDRASARRVAGGVVTNAPTPVGDLVDPATRTPLVLYMPVSAASLRTLVAADLARPVHLILEGLDDQPERLRRIVESAARPDLGADVLARIEPALRRLPPLLAAAVRELLLAPTSIPDARALAGRAGMTRRTLDRWLTRADLAPVRTLLNVSLACHPAIGMYAGSQNDARDSIASNAPDREAMARRLRRLLGPDVQLHQMPTDAAADLLATRLRRGTAEHRSSNEDSSQPGISATRDRSAGAA